MRFSFASASWMDANVDVNFDDKPLTDVLDYLLEDHDMEYKFVSNNILLRKNSKYSTIADQNYRKCLHVKGKVVMESVPTENLAFATIAISNTNIGTYTDDSGAFDIEIPAAHLSESIVVSYVGFEQTSYKISELEDSYLLVALDNQPYAISEITIQNRKKPIKIGNDASVLTLNSTQISSDAAGVLGADVNRSIQLLPGIAAHDDDSADIKIRGSNSDQTMMILDGMSIYNTDHYFGIFSGVNAGFIDSVNIYKNTYPIKYGGKTAGLVEMFSDREQVDKTAAEINLDLLSVSAQSDIPLSKNGSLHIAARTTYRDVSNNQFNSRRRDKEDGETVSNFGVQLDNKKSDPSFHFYDANASYKWRKNSREPLQLNFFRSGDNLENKYDITIQNNNDDEVNLVAIESTEWSTTSSSALWSTAFGKSFDLHNRAYFTLYETSDRNTIRLAKKFKKGSPQLMIQNPEGVDLGAEQRNELLDFGVDAYLKSRFAIHNFEVGALAAKQDVDYAFIENNERNIFGRVDVHSVGVFGSYIYTPSDRFSTTASLRTTYYDVVDQLCYSPRFVIGYRLSDAVSMKGSYSYVQQVVRQLYYEYRSEPLDLWVASGQNDIPVLASQNFMLGTTVRLGAFTVDLEAFQKNLTGTMEYAVLNPLATANDPDMAQEYRLFKGEGLVRGLDAIISYGYKNYDSYLSYTWSKNYERYDEIFRNQYYASENDRRHQLKWVNTMTTGKWTFDINGIYSSGRPYTDVANTDGNGDIRDADPDRRLNRLPAYARIDIGAGYKFKLAKKDATVSLSVFNLMDANNVRYIQSVNTVLTAGQQPVNTVIGNESSLLSRTVNVGFGVKF